MKLYRLVSLFTALMVLACESDDTLDDHGHPGDEAGGTAAWGTAGTAPAGQDPAPALAGGAGGATEPDDEAPSGSPCGEAGCVGEAIQCTMAAFKDALDCGAPTSNRDENCRIRKRCNDDAECDDGALCVTRAIQDPGLFGSSVSFCSTAPDGRCVCGVTADVDHRTYCIPVELEDTHVCDTRGLDCEALSTWHFRLTLVDRNPLPSSALTRLEACIEEVATALTDQCE